MGVLGEIFGIIPYLTSGMTGDPPYTGCTYLLIILSDEGLRANLHFSDIGVLIKNMNVIVWRDAVDAFSFCCSA